MTLTRDRFELAALHLAMLFALAFLVFFGFAAHAQDVLPPVLPAPGPSIGSILLGFLTPANIGGGAAAVLSLLGGLTFFTDRRKKIVATCAHDSFMIVEDIIDNIPDGPVKDGFKKADEGLKVADDWMKAHGWRPLKPGEQAAVAQQFKAMNGATVVAAAAQVAAPGPK